MTRLAILGAGGHGRVIADAARASKLWAEVVFFDDSPTDSRVAGNTEVLLEALGSFDGVVVGVGDNVERKKKYELLLKAKAKLVSIVHPMAYIAPDVELGLGSVVFANAVVNTGAVVGCGCIINTLTSIDHDCHLGHFVHISPGANLGGNVAVGDESWLGIGCAVKHGVSIGAGAKIGAGAAVVKNILHGTTVVGVPAAPMQ